MMLVVDQDVNRRIIAETLLRTRGWLVRWAQDRSETLQFIENGGSDIITLDLALADPGDWQLVRTARSAAGALPIVMLSDRRESELDRLAGDLHGVSFLPNQLDALALVAGIEDLLAQSRRHAQSSGC